MDATNPKPTQREGSVERQPNVIMAMEILNCSLCREPLRPAIYQCSCGHFICKTCHSYKSPKKKKKKMCSDCSRPFSQRAYGMERVLANIFVPCKYGCAKKTTSWYENERHEMYCLNGPALCPAHDDSPRCDFIAPMAELIDHMSGVHKWPTTRFRHDMQFYLPVGVEPVVHLLRCEDDDDHHIFLLGLSDSLDKRYRAVYIEPVGRFDSENEFGCSVSVTWDSFGRNQHRSGSCDSIIRTDPKNCLCFFPSRSHAVLKIILCKKGVNGAQKEVEKDDPNNSSYHEDEDDETDDYKSDWSCAFDA
ncbi:hypothetical protein QYE76_009225 [Lolium multiflorum]|uniref:RING-type E3 ubiquitin transferase n=1 Tax=Lolium multiflorum TaxID=4521 RepID=A0AAD8TUN5_LOLMU|nr:hypothetical protein QYE76_009225 [Lolium multiflorum]